MQGGLILEAYKGKDKSHERTFGAAPSEIEIKPLGRSIDGIPVIAQEGNTCVSCTLTWIKQFDESEKSRLSWPFLAKKSGTTAAGATVSQVVRPATAVGIPKWEVFEDDPFMSEIEASNHRLPTPTYLTDYSPASIYAALERGPLAVGILNFRNIGAHMMAAFDVTEDGKSLKCANWWDKTKQLVEEVPFSDIEVAISFAESKDGYKGIPSISVLTDKLVSFIKYTPMKAIASLFMLLAGGFSTAYGAGYAPVSSYESRTTSYITSSVTTIPVSSVKDKGGNTIDLTLLSSSSTPNVYFNLEPGSDKEELVICTGISGSSWTGCARGIAFQGTTVTVSTTLAQAHNPGSRIIMTNLGSFYSNELVSVRGDQTIYDSKTFNAFPAVTSTSASPPTAAQLATKYYVDNIGAGGFTASNVSSTLGLQAITSGIPGCPAAAACVGINISTTSSGLYFDNTFGGRIAIQTSSTGGLVVNGSGRLVLDTADDLTWAGNVTTTGILAVQTPTSTLDAVNKFYLDQQVSASIATGTAGIAISSGNAVYLSTTGTLFLADADATSTAQTFVGIATNVAVNGGEVRFVKPGGILITTGLSQGQDYYMSGTAGTLSVTRPALPTLPVKVGFALSATRLLVQSPTIHIISSVALGSFTTNQTVTLGVTPDRIDVFCGDTAGTNHSHGEWVWDRTTSASTTFSQGTDDDAVPYQKSSAYAVCKWEETTNEFIAFIIPTQTGFTLTPLDAWAGTARFATYIAEYSYP